MSIADLVRPKTQSHLPPYGDKRAPSPVRLEVNRTGLWTAVVQFDAHDAISEAAVREAVQLLAEVDAEAVFRIVMVNLHREVLMNYSRAHGWAPGK